MDEPLQALEHAQKTAIDLATQLGCVRGAALLMPVVRETTHARRISIPFPLHAIRFRDQP
jgi:hypothetical protein